MFELGEAIVDDILDRGEMPANHANPSEGGFDWAPPESPVVTTPSFYILGLSLPLSPSFSLSAESGSLTLSLAA